MSFKRIARSLRELRTSGDPVNNLFIEDMLVRYEFHSRIGGTPLSNIVPAESGSKVPFREKRLKDESNYGFVPKKGSQLFILDLDVHENGVKLVDQIEFFSSFFGFNLRETLSVITPTGGVHCYMQLPKDFDMGELKNFPSSTLRTYADKFAKVMDLESVEIDADVRSGLSEKIFIMGPGSTLVEKVDKNGQIKKPLLYKSYFVANERFGFNPLGFDAPIMIIPEDGIQRMREVGALRVGKNPNNLNDFIEDIDLDEDLEDILASNNLKSKLPSIDQIKALKNEVKARKDGTFHARRAFVKAALGCCYSDAVIKAVCIKLDINKDTARDGYLSNDELEYDILNFTPELDIHTRYCGSGKDFTVFKHSERDKLTVEEIVEINKEKVANRRLSRNSNHRRIEPRVLDVSAISFALRGESKRKTLPQHYFDALKIVDYFLQPLSNVGAKTIVLARSAVSERLEMTESRVSQAMRMLREKKIISVHTKQKTGLAATYTVSKDFNHDYLTKTLRIAWGINGVKEDGSEEFLANLYLDRKSLSFREVFTGKIVETNASILSQRIDYMNSHVAGEVVNDFGAAAALSYLKSEAEKRGLTVIGGSETIVVDTETGELVSVGFAGETSKIYITSSDNSSHSRSFKDSSYEALKTSSRNSILFSSDDKELVSVRPPP